MTQGGLRKSLCRKLRADLLFSRYTFSADKAQTPPSYGFGRYGFGFSGPGLPSARQVLCGDAPRPFFYHLSVHLSSVLGRTELCHEVWAPGPQKPQNISNENHHLALIERQRVLCTPEIQGFEEAQQKRCRQSGKSRHQA